MFVIYFKIFAGYIDIQTIGNDNVPSESPLLIYYYEEGEVSKHEVLKRFHQILLSSKIQWIKPVKEITKEWVIDLAILKSSFKFLHRTKYLRGKITIEPEYSLEKEKNYNADGKEIEKVIKTYLKIRISENIENTQFDIEDKLQINELVKPLSRFNQDHIRPDKCGFLMMKFEDSPIQIQIIEAIEEIFNEHDLTLLRADSKHYSDDLLTNIKTYMFGCGFGIALFERINSNYFNPNVSLEIGYMMALNKPILFLKDKTLASLQTDLVGKLYSEFDFQKPKESLRKVIIKWLKDLEIIE